MRRAGIWETILFYMGITGVVAAALTAAIIRLWGVHLTGYFPACISYTFLGIPCPGCGGTRAVEYLLKGQLWQSFVSHPLVLYGTGVYLYYMISYGYVTFGKKETFRFYKLSFWQEILIACGVLVLVQWIVKLIIW